MEDHELESAPLSEAPLPEVESTPAASPSSQTATPAAGGGRRPRKEKQGIVVSDKMQKTIIIKVERRLKHPIYGKFIKKSTKFAVHDETNDARVGDRVRIAETRPLSKTKRWRLVEILERAK
jgi:small subunit ribosomal protein S17